MQGGYEHQLYTATAGGLTADAPMFARWHRVSKGGYSAEPEETNVALQMSLATQFRPGCCYCLHSSQIHSIEQVASRTAKI